MLRRRMVEAPRAIARSVRERRQMRWMIALAFVLMSLVSIGATACSEAAVDTYDNDTHGGYPGPGTRSQNRDS